jgi:hexosaminidase
MKITRWISLACFAFLPLVSHAQVNDTVAADTVGADTVRALRVLPAPKEARLAKGRFVIEPSTTILIGNSEDRTAAETLQEEIQERTGLKLSISAVTSAPKTTGHISLGRLTDRGLQSYLESQGVKAGDEFGNDHLGKQGYVIRATGSEVLVAGRTAQGLFYGVQTLRQLLHADGPGGVGKTLVVPALLIRDWPSMEWRGVSDDISRGPIPTLDYLKVQIRTLAEYKINLVGFNIEHVFDFQTQPLVPPKQAALTPGEIKELVDYAGTYYITLLPEQQAFGHLHQFLKYEIYSDLVETPHGHVLTPTNPKTYDFIRQIYSEVVPLFPGPFFHIGADETIELGLGQTKDLAGQQGLGRVYLEHLQKVFEIMQPYHKQLMFWGDIAVKYPEMLTIVPKDMIAVPWDYVPKPSYENLITPYTNAGLRVVVAPGAGNWGVIWPDLESAFVNIRNFVRDGQAHQAIGSLNSIWNDDGESLLDMTWPALVFGAAASWQPGESSIDDFKNSYDGAFYRNNDDRTFAEVMENLDRSHTLLAGVKLDSASHEIFWSDPFSEGGANLAAKALPVTHDLRISAERAAESLMLNRAKAHLHRGTIDDMLLAAWHLDTLGMKIQFTSEISRFYWDAYQNQTDKIRVQNDLDEMIDINGRLETLRDSITEMRKMYAEGWTRENNPYWLDNVLIRYDNLALEVQAKIVAVQQAERQYASTKSLPAPEQLGFFLK